MWFTGISGQDDLKARYRQLVKKYHPDNHVTGDVEKFRQIKREYDSLTGNGNGEPLLKEAFDIGDIGQTIFDFVVHSFARKTSREKKELQFNSFYKDFKKRISKPGATMSDFFTEVAQEANKRCGKDYTAKDVDELFKIHFREFIDDVF